MTCVLVPPGQAHRVVHIKHTQKVHSDYESLPHWSRVLLDLSKITSSVLVKKKNPTFISRIAMKSGSWSSSWWSPFSCDPLVGFMLTSFHPCSVLDVRRWWRPGFLQVLQVWISCKSFQIPGSILANNASMSQNDFSSSLVMMMRYPAMKFIPWNTQTTDCITVLQSTDHSGTGDGTCDFLNA